MATLSKMNILSVENKNTGEVIDPVRMANEIKASAAQLSAEARNKAGKIGTIGASDLINVNWPEEPKLRELLVKIENVMSYYGINSVSTPKNSALRSSVLRSDSYYDSVLKVLKDLIATYVNASLTIRCLDGKMGRGIYCNIDVENVGENELRLYGIRQIAIGKTAKTKTGDRKDNQFKYIFDTDGNCIDKNIIADTMKKQFTQNNCDLILSDIGFIMERFNTNIGQIMSVAEKQTLSYKFKNHKQHKADGGEKLLERLSSLKANKELVDA